MYVLIYNLKLLVVLMYILLFDANLNYYKLSIYLV